MKRTPLDGDDQKQPASRPKNQNASPEKRTDKAVRMGSQDNFGDKSALDGQR